jgi:hypothetical protein
MNLKPETATQPFLRHGRVLFLGNANHESISAFQCRQHETANQQQPQTAEHRLRSQSLLGPP